MIAKVAVAGVLAGAVLFATPKQADAQVSVRLGFGRTYVRPTYAPPVYGPDFYGERRREEWIRHERWVREREFRGRRPVYGYGGGFYGR